MNSEWIEVWIDQSVQPPYILVVMPDVRATGEVQILDPKENHRVIHTASTYQNAKSWLLEDEYVRVDGRMQNEW